MPVQASIYNDICTALRLFRAETETIKAGIETRHGTWLLKIRLPFINNGRLNQPPIFSQPESSHFLASPELSIAIYLV